jgi:hypothetical protein
MIDVIDELELDAVITELDALERVGDRNDGN